VPSQQPQGQLQTQHSVDTNSYDMDNHNIKSKTSYRQALEEKHINNNNDNNGGGGDDDVSGVKQVIQN
jgi:hypothetical protein